jgi:hypothetical protein
MATGRSLQRLGLLPVLLVSHCLSLPIHAQRAKSLADPVRDLVERSVAEASSASGNGRLNIRRREDLESLLFTLQQQKSAGDVYFYEIQSPPGMVSETPLVWLVAVVGSEPDVYRLYNFLGSAEPDAASQEFNRFTSRLALLVQEKEATGLARLFLNCVEGDHQEAVVDNETELRLAVQNYYFAAYGDLWRALDAYSRWWQAFQVRAPDLAPPTAARDTNGRYHVVLNTLITLPGKHPQVRKWELEVSGGGEIRTLTIQLIFPDQPRWLSYDLDRGNLDTGDLAF